MNEFQTHKLFLQVSQKNLSHNSHTTHRTVYTLFQTPLRYTD